MIAARWTLLIALQNNVSTATLMAVTIAYIDPVAWNYAWRRAYSFPSEPRPIRGKAHCISFWATSRQPNIYLPYMSWEKLIKCRVWGAVVQVFREPVGKGEEFRMSCLSVMKSLNLTATFAAIHLLAVSIGAVLYWMRCVLFLMLYITDVNGKPLFEHVRHLCECSFS